MRAWYLVMAVALVAGCKRDGGDDTGTTHGLPDPLDGLESLESCDNFQAGNPPQFVGAATAYLAGDYARDGDNIAGFEYWYWIPNDCLALQDDNWEEDTPCTFVWDVFGDIDEDPDCTGCIMEITGEAFTNDGATDCPAIGGFSDNEFTYEVRPGDNEGEIRLFFTSGTEFAAGEYNDEGLVWTGDANCEAIGSSTDCN